MNATPPLTIKSCPVGRSARLISLCGEVDEFTRPELDTALAEVWEPPPPGALLVDLGATTFFGSSGLQCLLAAHCEASARGATFVVCNPSHPALRALKAAALDELFPLYDTSSAAVAHLVN